MKLARYTPAASNRSLLGPFEGLFRHTLGDFSAFDPFFELAGLPSTMKTTTSLAVDVYEDDGHYYARFEVPGVKKEDARIELEDHTLSVSVTRKTQTAEGESSFEMTRTLTVPDGIEEEHISAKLEDGLLTVTLPKAEARKPRVIELN